jgi:hypothetical protein
MNIVTKFQKYFDVLHKKFGPARVFKSSYLSMIRRLTKVRTAGWIRTEFFLPLFSPLSYPRQQLCLPTVHFLIIQVCASPASQTYSVDKLNVRFSFTFSFPLQ